jgi:glucose/arabinose dehydrogenase
MYASEHGNNANDEINRIEPGENYGWPIIEGIEEQDRMMTPLFTSGAEETWSPSGMNYFDGKLYVAGLRNQLCMNLILRKMYRAKWFRDLVESKMF